MKKLQNCEIEVIINYMKLIKRTQYLNKLKNVQATPDIKIITGLRRSGKSKLLESFITHIKKTESQANIIHINFNLLDFESLTNYHALYDYIQSKHKENFINYVFIDEVQMCESFEKAINSLHASEKFRIFITGSNAFLMSSDLATLFTGRCFEIQVFPFSFAEYLCYNEVKNFDDFFTLNEKLSVYLKEGGLAGSYLYNTENEKYRYINDEVFNALIVRDIITKHKIKNKQLLEKITDYLSSNIGNITSVRNIANTFISANSKVNDKTIGSYIDYLLRAFAFYKVRRYDIKGKRYLSSEDKYYLCDHSFKYARLGTKNMDLGHSLENIVAIELLRRDYQVYVGVLYKKEIDFVAIKQNEKIYIQVSDDISNEETFTREITPLLKIQDAYPKILLSRTRNETTQYEGIQIIDIAHWLGTVQN